MNSLAIIRAIRGKIFEPEGTEFVHGLCFLCYLLFKSQSSGPVEAGALVTKIVIVFESMSGPSKLAGPLIEALA